MYYDSNNLEPAQSYYPLQSVYPQFNYDINQFNSELLKTDSLPIFHNLTSWDFMNQAFNQNQFQSLNEHITPNQLQQPFQKQEISSKEADSTSAETTNSEITYSTKTANSTSSEVTNETLTTKTSSSSSSPPLLICNKPSMKNFHCTDCNRWFASANHLQRHKNTEKHNKTKSLIERYKANNQFSIDRSNEYSSTEIISKISDIHHYHSECKQPRIACINCNVEFDFVADLQEHNVIFHFTTDSKVKCVGCDKLFSKICYLIQHIKALHSGVKPFRCPKCGKYYRTEKDMTTHLGRHDSMNRQFKCDICPKQFHYRSDFNRHRQGHKGYIVNVCDICNKGFSRKDHLTKHKLIHKKI